jgi:hypothetical protein
VNESRTTPVPFPPGRYGRRREPRRRPWLTWLIGLVVVLAGGAVTLKLYRQYEAAPYQVRAVNVTQITDRSITITFEVSTPDGSAACTLTARNRAGAEVGRGEVEISGGQPVSPGATGHWMLTTHQLPTTERAFVGEVAGCGPGPGRP